ncbi:hypothetical protein DNTS_000464, partial [Danionella cerebrum]
QRTKTNPPSFRAIQSHIAFRLLQQRSKKGWSCHTRECSIISRHDFCWIKRKTASWKKKNDAGAERKTAIDRPRRVCPDNVWLRSDPKQITGRTETRVPLRTADSQADGPMAAQVEVDTGRPYLVGSRLHLSQLIDSSNKSLMENSGGPQGSLIIPSDPNKPVPSPKPRLTPKPFTVEKNPTIRPILAPKPQPKSRIEQTRPVSFKPDLPSTPKPQPASKPSLPSAFKTGFKTSGQTNKPAAPFKPASSIAPGDFNKLGTQTGEVLRRTSFGATQTGGHSSTSGAEWPFVPRKKQPGPSITRAKSLGFLSEIGLHYDDNVEESGAKNESSPSFLRVHNKGSRPRPVSAVFPQNPEAQVVPPTPAPRWAKGRPLSSDLTSKFESIGLSLHRQSGNDGGKENAPDIPEDPVTLETILGAEMADDLNHTERGTQKLDLKDDEFKKDPRPENTGGSSIKRRISLLLDSSSSPFSVMHEDAEGTETRSPGLVNFDADGAMGVKQRVKELNDEVPTVQSSPQKPQFKPRSISDRTKKFEPELESLGSSDSKCSEEGEEALNKKAEGQFNTQQDKKMPTLGVLDMPTLSTLNKGGVQTVRASVYEHVVKRHNVQVMEDCPSQSLRTQQETTVKPLPTRNHSLRIPDNTLKANDVVDLGSLTVAAYKGQISPSSSIRVDHVFDAVSFGESCVVSETLPTAHLEDKALTLRSRRSTTQGEQHKVTNDGSNLAKEDGTTPRYLRVGALQKWNATETGGEFEKERERQKEILRRMEEEIQRQTEIHMIAAAALEQEEEDEAESNKWSEAKRDGEREREDSAAPKRPKMLDAEEQVNKPRATYFALTGQIQEPVLQVERKEDKLLFGQGKLSGLLMEGGGLKEEVTFDDCMVRSRQRCPQIPLTPFRRNPSFEAATQRDSQEHKQSTGLRTDHGMEEREQKVFRVELEMQKEVERLCDIKKQEDSEKRREVEMQKERERQRDVEKLKEQERDRQKEMERQREVERHKRDKERQKQIEYERLKAAEKELEQQREFERQRQKEFEREKERMLEQEMLRFREFEKQRDLERERERQLELERQREIERQKQRELEKQREIERLKELERQQELERQRELDKRKELEKERQRKLGRQRELDKQRDLERQRNLERQQEIERQMEIERQKEIEKQKQREVDIEIWKRQKVEEREAKRHLEELERIKELEKRQLLDFEIQKQRERPNQKEQAKRKSKKERHRKETEHEIPMPTSPLRPKVLDLDSVSLGNRTRRDSHDNSPTARWKQPTLLPDELYKPGILDIDSFRGQTQSNSRPVVGFSGMDCLDGDSMIPARPQAKQINIPPPQTAPQLQSPSHPQFHPHAQGLFQPSPTERLRTQLPPPLQPQILHQPKSLPFVTDKHRPLIEATDWAFDAQQPLSCLTHEQSNFYRHTPAELTVDEPLWVSIKEGSRRPISTRPGGLEQQLHQEDSGIILTSSSSSMNPTFTSKEHSTYAAHMVPFQTPMVTAQPNLVPSVIPILSPERCWTSVPLGPSPPTKSSSRETLLPASQAVSFVTDPKLNPNWELASQGLREKKTSHKDKVQQKRSRSMCRRSAPTEGSADAATPHVRTRRSRSAHKEREQESLELIKPSTGGKEDSKDTDKLVQETDSQYGTWETGLHTEDSLTPATPSSEGNITPSPRKPSLPLTSEDPAFPDTTDASSTSSHQQQSDLVFPEEPTVLLDTSVLRGRVKLNKQSTRRAPPSRAARHSALLTQVPEGIGAEVEWRYKDSTEDKTDSGKQVEEFEEQPKGIESRTSSVSQTQRVALFPGMDTSALKAQLKKRGESDNQTDGSSPAQPARSPKSPFLPRAARVLPPAASTENGGESSPQWLKELKSKKRLSQYENDKALNFELELLGVHLAAAAEEEDSVALHPLAFVSSLSLVYVHGAFGNLCVKRVSVRVVEQLF